MKNTFTTFTGRRVNLSNFSVEDVDIKDIAHALSNLCRFGGHSNKFYSVAQHSVRVALAVNRRRMLKGLLHDASEAYLGDVITPLKAMLPDYIKMENKITSVIFKRFGVEQRFDDTEVHDVDRVAMHTEFKELYPPMLSLPNEPVSYLPYQEALAPHDAECLFLMTFTEALVWQ